MPEPLPVPSPRPLSAHRPAHAPAPAPAVPAIATQAAAAAAANTLRACKADPQRFARWRAARGFVPTPAEPATVGAYLASLAETHAPSTIRRRLAVLGKMHRFNVPATKRSLSFAGCHILARQFRALVEALQSPRRRPGWARKRALAAQA